MFCFLNEGGEWEHAKPPIRASFWPNPSIRPYFRSNPNPHYLKALSGIVSLQRTVDVVFMPILRGFVSLLVCNSQMTEEDRPK